jgi:twitching motility protein PilT
VHSCAGIFVLKPSTSAGTAARIASVPELLAHMLRVSPQVSDLIFSPGRPPQVQVRRGLIPVEAAPFTILSADDTRRLASELLGNNKNAISALREHGACDVSYGLPGVARFRVNVFIQRGSCAVIMRVIPTGIPSFEALGLPTQLASLAHLQDGIVLVSGGAGSGKSSTLAALLDSINDQHSYHVITIEDPIEFLHNHKRCTIHQRELHSDTPSFALALRSALRQAPNVILVGDIRDRETLDIVLEAAETGHLVLSSVHAADIAKTLGRLVSYYPLVEQPAERARIARCFRAVVCQRLLPGKNGEGRVPAVEILKSTPQTRDAVEFGDPAHLHETMQNGATAGMQIFDDEILRLVRQGLVTAEVATQFASHPVQLREQLERDSAGSDSAASAAHS